MDSLAASTRTHKQTSTRTHACRHTYADTHADTHTQTHADINGQKKTRKIAILSLRHMCDTTNRFGVTYLAHHHIAELREKRRQQ